MNPFCILPRYTPLKRKRSTPRRGPLRDTQYRRYVKQFACVVFEYSEGPEIPCAPFAFVDPAHTGNNGMSSKGSDSSCVPLCRKHHREYDANRAAFEMKYGLNMKRIATELYQKYLRAETPVRRKAEE